MACGEQEVAEKDRETPLPHAHDNFTLDGEGLSVTVATGQCDNVRQGRLVTQVTNCDLLAA